MQVTPISNIRLAGFGLCFDWAVVVQNDGGTKLAAKLALLTLYNIGFGGRWHCSGGGSTLSKLHDRL